jgi:hypothetical protein
LADINGYHEGYLSNQLLPGLPLERLIWAVAGLIVPGGDGFNFSSTAGEYFTCRHLSGMPPVLTVNGVNADYGMTHVFVNEVSNDIVPLTILFSPNATNVVEADVFSNLNRRDHANHGCQRRRHPRRHPAAGRQHHCHRRHQQLL